MRPNVSFSPKSTLLTLCVSAAFAAASTAHAAPFGPYDISASYNLGTSSSAGATSTPGNACGDASDGSTGGDTLVFTGDALGNSIGIHTYGCDFSGFQSFGSRSSGENTFYVDGNMHLDTTINGDSFSFFVNSGHVGSFGSTAFGAGEFEKSMLAMKISIGGVTEMDEKWTTAIEAGGAATATHDSLGPYSISSPLSSGAGYVDFEVFGGFFTISGLGAGDHTLVYDITSQALGNVTATSVCRAPVFNVNVEVGATAVGGGEGGGTAAEMNAYCGAGAQTGDPFPPIARAIPEPESGALLAMGSAMLALASLKKRRRKTQAA